MPIASCSGYQQCFQQAISKAARFNRRLTARGAAMREGDVVFSIRNLVCGYSGKPVVVVPQLDVRDHEVIAVVGRSGSGKSTFLATLAGALEPLGGAIRLDGAEAGAATLRDVVARTLQSFPLLHWLTVEQNLKLSARVRGARTPDVRSVLKQFSAGHLAGRFPKELSGGERARASLSQAALSAPRLLLLDEPLTGLDPVVRHEVAAGLFEFAKSRSCAVMMVTHDLADAVRYADRIVALRPRDGVAQLDFDIEADSDGAADAALKALAG